VSVLSILSCDTGLALMLSFFIRVMNVVRLSPRRAAAHLVRQSGRRIANN
jgi:hypothetical protein